MPSTQSKNDSTPIVRAILDDRKSRAKRIKHPVARNEELNPKEIKPQQELTDNSGFKHQGYLYGKYPDFDEMIISIYSSHKLIN
ncbi:hypothetical protein C8R34_1532 [Nitrosomonas sp. Nm84]|nr:hypothetical protein C8R34_1532 [Nitrosomonas sp. Nm84]